MADTLVHPAGAVAWNVDPAHSSVDFSVRHLGVFSIKGSLGTVTGTAESADGKLSKISLSVDATKISTNNEQRDAHLKSADFLNTDAYPTITFDSTAVVETSEMNYSVTGDLSIAGQTKPVTVDFEVVFPVKDPWGNTRSGATGKSVLKRSEWGITFNSVMESGHLMVADEVNFTFDIQVVVAA